MLYGELIPSVRVWKPMLWLFALALGVRLVVLGIGLANADVNGNNPAFYWHDSGQYLIPATSLLESGSYAEEVDGRQVPYYKRPPAYPLFLAACFAVGGQRDVAALLPQAILGAVTCSLTFWLGALLFGSRVGWIAGLLMSLDQILIAYANKIMAETFSIFFLVGSSLLVLQFLARRRPWLLWLAAVALGVSTLAHGSTLYYAVVPLALVAAWPGLSTRERALHCGLFLLAYLLTIGTWQMRNRLVFGVYQVVPVTHTLVQTAARVMSTHPPYPPYAELANDLHEKVRETFCRRHGLSRVEWSDAEFRVRYFRDFLETEKAVAMEFVRAYPMTFAREAARSFLRMTVLPLPYAEVCRFGLAQRLDDKEKSVRRAMFEALKGLRHGHSEAFWSEVRQIPFCKLFGFGWNALYWLLTIPPALWGTWLLVRKRLCWQCFLLLGTLAYFAVTNSIVQAGDGMQRYRLRILPYLYCVAAVGWVTLGKRRTAPPGEIPSRGD